MKTGTLDKMKFMVLKTRLGLPRYQAIGLLEGLWYLTATNAQDGAIGRFSDLEIAAWLEYPGDPGQMITALVEAGFVDRSEEHRLVVHDWAEHAPMHIKANLSKHGKSFARGGDYLPPKEPPRDAPKEPPIEGSHGNIPPNLTKPNQEKTSSSCSERKRAAEPDDSMRPATADGSPQGTADGSQVVHEIGPLVDGSVLPVTARQVEKFRAAYPGVDTLPALRRANAWLEANPARRKTRRGALKFANGWLAREQDRPRSSPSTPRPANPGAGAL